MIDKRSTKAYKLEKENKRLNNIIKGLKEERDYLFNKMTTESNYEIEKLIAESTEWESKYYDMQDNFHNANEEIERLNNIIKEVREYIEKAELGTDITEEHIYYLKNDIVGKRLLEILDKKEVN